MAIPWLIGGAVVLAGKAVYDSYQESEEEERQARRRRRETREVERQAEEKKQAELQAEAKRKEQEKLKSLQAYFQASTEELIDKYQLEGINAAQLCKKYMTSEKAISDSMIKEVEGELINSLEQSSSYKVVKADIAKLKEKTEKLNELSAVIRG